MSQATPPPSVNPLHAPPMPMAEAYRRAAPWALYGTVAAFAVFALIGLGFRANADDGPSLGAILGGAAVRGLFIGLLAFVCRLLSLSRQLLARSFTVAAFGATFFGLFMLVVFFWSLGRDTVEWFRVMPDLVREHNTFMEARAAEAGNVEASIKAKLKEIDAEMAFELSQASTEKEKVAIRELYEKTIKPSQLADLQVTLQEYLKDVKSLRTDQSPPALVGHFFTAGPSNDKSDAGIFTALLGSLWLAVITIVCAVPLGVGAAIYLEEYRASGFLNRVIQINIRNLAGVPSVVYGILGGFVFVELIFKNLEGQIYTPGFLEYLLGAERAQGLMSTVFGASISARNTLGGGLTLALLTLPVVIVTAQEAIRAVPISIRHGALALGATHWQVVWHHVLPLARPGILTGTILSLSRAVGEAAPLVLFGALLYSDQTPSLFSRFTVMPMQIFDWTGRPELEWKYNAAVASLVLLGCLLLLNATAIYLRQRAQQNVKW